MRVNLKYIGNKLYFWLLWQVLDYFKLLTKCFSFSFLLDPTYMIRAVPSNASDNIYSTLLAQSAVHGAMAGYTGFTVGPVNGRHAYIPYYVSSVKFSLLFAYFLQSINSVKWGLIMEEGVNSETQTEEILIKLFPTQFLTLLYFIFYIFSENHWEAKESSHNRPYVGKTPIFNQSTKLSQPRIYQRWRNWPGGALSFRRWIYNV